MCVLTKERYKTYLSVTWFMSQGLDLGVLGVQKKKSQHGHVAYQIEKDDEYNTIQVKFYPRVKLVTLGLRSEAWGYAMARHRLQDLVYN